MYYYALSPRIKVLNREKSFSDLGALSAREAWTGTPAELGHIQRLPRGRVLELSSARVTAGHSAAKQEVMSHPNTRQKRKPRSADSKVEGAAGGN